MIFVTVGSQLPFDRLINAVDKWAANNTYKKVFAQIGVSEYIPQNIEFCETMIPSEYNSYFKKADIIVAHAGMGTIISALELGKTLILLPRLASKGEHRNDHQLSTVKRFATFTNIHVSNNESELTELINNLVNKKNPLVTHDLPEVSSELISAIKNFVDD